MKRAIRGLCGKKQTDSAPANWQRTMGRELGWLLAVKFAVLVCLWLLFFSPGHRQPVDADATSRRLSITPVINAPGTNIQPEEKSHD